MYRVIRKSVCLMITVKDMQKYIKELQSLTMITYFELGIADGVSVSLVSNVWRLAGDTSNIICTISVF
jgi:hypothetical protein